MKGIILAAGNGTRLFPLSESVSKILLPVYDKPLIYYSLSTLMQAGIKEILVITKKTDLNIFKKLLEDGSQFGLKIQYAIQYEQRGIADALIIAERFIGDNDVCLILGDNIFHHEKLSDILKVASSDNIGVTVFGYPVSDPERFGVIEFDDQGNVISIEEKPSEPRSNIAVVGLYFFSNGVCKIAKKLKPSARGELEITDLNIKYLEKGLLKAVVLDKDILWMDVGTFDSLLEASIRVRDTQRDLNKPICCPEQTALSVGLVSPEIIKERAASKKMSEYYKSVGDLCDRF